MKHTSKKINKHLPEKPMKTLIENLFFCTMSFWMVGNIDAPPNANRMVPKARKKLLKSWESCFTDSTKSNPSMTICAKMKMQANAVVTIAPIPTTLKQHRLYNEYK
jgi:hypothetical protein